MCERSLTLSVVLDLPGESATTVRATLAHCRELVDCVEEIHASILIPLPGAPAFAPMLAHPKLRANYMQRDVFDWESARRDWIRTFCGVGYEELLEAQKELLLLAPRASSFGRRAMQTDLFNRTQWEGNADNPRVDTKTRSKQEYSNI